MYKKKETDYVRCLQEVEKFFLWRLTRPWLWLDFIYKLTNDYKENKKCLDIMRDFTMNVIEKRKKIWLNYFEQYSSKNQLAKDDSKNETVETEENKEEEKFKNFFTGTKTRLAFLDLLLQQHFKDPKNFTLEDVREETDTFMFAGHDTTAMGLSWTIYMLGRYPLVQQKARNEVDEIIANMSSTCSCKHKIEFSLEDLKEMKYLECVLKEVQRIYPTAPFFGRRVTEDIPMKNYTIPEGSTVTIFTYAMHRNPKFYPNPLKFDPDRFLPENKSERHAYAFIPFSAGARNCIGQKFSSIEQKLILAKLLHNFYFESVDAEDKLVIVGEMVLKSKNGLRSKIYRRFNNEERYCSNCKLIEKNNLKEFVSKNL
nr:cytochrome p450 4CF4 [Polyphagotarsonemus latus]